jgi:hypothetical protein
MLDVIKALESFGTIGHWMFFSAPHTYEECLHCGRPPFVAWTYLDPPDDLERIFRDATASYHGATSWAFQTLEPDGRRWVLMPAKLRKYSDDSLRAQRAIAKLARKDPQFGNCAHRDLRVLLAYIRAQVIARNGT